MPVPDLIRDGNGFRISLPFHPRFPITGYSKIGSIKWHKSDISDLCWRVGGGGS